MNILFYTPFDTRSRDTETLMITFAKKGNNVFYVSQKYGEEIQEILLSNFINVSNSMLAKRPTSFFSTLLEIFFLIRYCRKNKIEILFSHLEPAHFIAVIVQFFITAKVVICRHHVDEIHMQSKHKLISYRLTYLLGRNFIVVSERAKKFMVENENVSASKISVIRLSYDFNLYAEINRTLANKYREKYSCTLLLITACRLVRDKRPELSIAVLEKLLAKGIDAKLIILGNGTLKTEIEAKLITKNLQEKVFLLGRVSNVLDYLAASDVLINPSIVDSSSVIVKEAGLAKIPVIACKEIGDLEEYIVNDINGFLVSKESFVEETTSLLSNPKSFLNDKNRIGEALHSSIIKNFSIDNNFKSYSVYVN